MPHSLFANPGTCSVLTSPGGRNSSRPMSCSLPIAPASVRVSKAGDLNVVASRSLAHVFVLPESLARVPGHMPPDPGDLEGIFIFLSFGNNPGPMSRV